MPTAVSERVNMSTNCIVHADAELGINATAANAVASARIERFMTGSDDRILQWFWGATQAQDRRLDGGTVRGARGVARHRRGRGEGADRAGSRRRRDRLARRHAA